MLRLAAAYQTWQGAATDATNSVRIISDLVQQLTTSNVITFHGPSAEWFRTQHTTDDVNELTYTYGEEKDKKHRY